MRSTILVLVVMSAVALGFGMYFFTSRSTVVRPEDRSVAPTAAVVPANSPTIVGTVEQVWWENYHQTTGQLSSRMRARRADPQPDGRVLLQEPQAEFFLSGGQLLRIRGKSGLVTMEQTAGRGTGGPMANQTPKRGLMQDVTIDLLPSPRASVPSLTITTNNAAFDNETLRIYTDAFVDSTGKAVVADQVPVVLRGADYDFDGWGLKIQWNEKHGRLDYLEITRGDRIVIKNPKAFLRWGVGGNEHALRDGDGRPVMLAGLNPLAAAEAVSNTPPKKKPATRVAVAHPPVAVTDNDAPLVYRAVLARSVRVNQGSELEVLADQMQLDFVLDGDGGDLVTQPAASAPSTSISATRPSTARTGGGNRKPTNAVVSPTPSQPATGPLTSAEPIIIRWEGPLVIVPVEGAMPDRLAWGQAIIRLVGVDKPVTARHSGGQLRCSKMTFWTMDSSMLLEGSAGLPVDLRDSRGASITSGRMDISQQRGTATLDGPSRAVIPMDGQTQGQSPMTADWSQQCVLFFSTTQPQQMTIERAQLRGDVTVRHPQLSLDSQTLDLAFSPTSHPAQSQSDPATGALKQLQATGSVRASTTDQEGARQNLECDRLALTTAPADEKGQMGLLNMQTATAGGNVRVTTSDGLSVAAERVFVQTRNDRPVLRLEGSPAVISQPQGSLSGNQIEIDPEVQQLTVIGPGRLDARQKPRPGDSTLPIEVYWKESLKADGLANRIECLGDVTAVYTQADGTVNTARGRRVNMTLADLPKSTVEKAPSPDKTALAAKTAMLSDKMLKTLSVEDGAQLTSLLTGADGRMLRRAHLESAIITYDQSARKLSIPGAGQMFLIDQRGDAQPKSGGIQPPSSLRGQTALSWKNGLIFDEDRRQLVMDGGVLIGHRYDENATLVNVSAQRLVADMEPAEGEASVSPMGGAMKLRRLRVDGGLVFTAQDRTFEADSVDFDPVTQVASAKGTEGRPVRQVSKEGLEEATFGAVEYDLKNGRFRLIDISANVRR